MIFHILHHGAALCQFTPDNFEYWGANDQPASNLRDVNCDGCIAAAHRTNDELLAHELPSEIARVQTIVNGYHDAGRLAGRPIIDDLSRAWDATATDDVTAKAKACAALKGYL